MTEKISDELNYSPVVSNHSTPVYRNVAPQNSATITLSATSTGQISEFIIPPSVFRFAKSRLNFDLNVTATADRFNMINANLLTTISRVVLYDSATNAQLLDISSFEKYASMVVPAATPMTEFLTKSFYGGNLGTTIAGLPLEDITKVTSGTTNSVSSSGTGVIDGATADIISQGGQIQRRQYYISAATNAANKLRVSLPLSSFKFTVLASEKLMYLPSSLVLQIYWNSTNNFAFCASSATNFATDAGAVGEITLTNVSLSLCTEGNLQVISSVIDRVMKEGISVPIAYPSLTRVNNAASTSVSTYIPLTKAYGNRILAIISANFNNLTTAAVRSFANAHGRFDLTSYNTFLNNVAIVSQSGFITSTRGEDYILANKEYLKGSVVGTVGDYSFAEWIHVDSFFGSKALHEVDQHEIDGLDVGIQTSTYSQQYNFTTGLALTYVSAIIGQKTLTLSSSGAMVV
jgi:hypothetical protein